MPEFVLVLTQSQHVRVLAGSLEEAKRFVAHADTDDLSSIAKCDSYFDWTLEVLEPDDPTFSWADGKALYRLDDGCLEEDRCAACGRDAVAWWTVTRTDAPGEPAYEGDAKAPACRLCSACLQEAATLPAATTEAELRERIATLKERAVARWHERRRAEEVPK